MFLRKLLYVCIPVLAMACNTNNKAQTNAFDSSKGLKDYYQSYFTMGVSVSPASLATEEADIILKHFGSLTAENAMKMKNIHPKENEYYWKDADSIAAFARRHHLKLRGHTLVWHQEVPDWMFAPQNGRPVTKEMVYARLQSHITTVMHRYKDVIYAWDVVNEAISDDKNEVYRKSKYYELCGEEYIAKAFEFAHKADPKAILFYNDYNESYPEKRKKIISMIKELQKKKVPIHAIGLQCHWFPEEPTQENLEAALKDFSALGLPLQITEMDVSVYKREPVARAKTPADNDTLYSAEKEKIQAEKYRMGFELFRKYKKHITGITFWNVTDRHTWMDYFPVKGRKDYPLLFDVHLQPKKAFWEVVKF